MSRQTAYDLLDVPRGLPGWKHTKKVQNALSEVLDAFECSADELPKVLQLALRTLSNADIRDQYDSFLEWSEDGDAVAFKNLDDIEEFRGKNTTTEFMARVVFDRMAARLGAGDLGPQATDWSRPEQVSYSYQNQHGVAPIRVDRSSPRLAVLADRSKSSISKSWR